MSTANLAPISDELLLAYLDGQLEQSQSINLNRLAASNPEISRRLIRLKRTQAQLLETFSAFYQGHAPLSFEVETGKDGEANNAKLQKPSLSVAPDQALQPLQPASGGFGRKSRRAILVCAAILTGAAFGFGFQHWMTQNKGTPQPQKASDRHPAALQAQAAPSSWEEEVARFHSFFPRETLTPHPDAISNPYLIGFALSKAVQKALAPPDLTKQGYTLFRGQTLNFRQDRMMQLTYASRIEPPLTFYILPGGGPDSAAQATAIRGHRAISWTSDKLRFFMIGEKSENDLMAIAAIAQEQLRPKS
jgi:anti-sigma factor RsiW